LHLEAEEFLHVFDDHDEEGQFDAERLGFVGRASHVGCAHVGCGDFQNAAGDVFVCDALDVSISHCRYTHGLACQCWRTLQNSKEGMF